MAYVTRPTNKPVGQIFRLVTPKKEQTLCQRLRLAPCEDKNPRFETISEAYSRSAS